MSTTDSGTGRSADRTTDGLARAVGALLRRDRATIAVAESCTGGMLLAALISVPGASAWVWGGVVAYSAAAKAVLAGLRPGSLDEHGTVSSATTIGLARAIRDLSGCTLGLAVTGWAGPEGGTEADPVGTVYLALAAADGIHERRDVLAGDREAVRRGAVDGALRWLCRRLGGADGTAP